MDPEIRQSAVGMCMRQNGIPASIAMLSTWHRIGGPMEQLLEQGRAGAYPTYTFCIFEILERCPDDRSGAGSARRSSLPFGVSGSRSSTTSADGTM